MSLFKYVVFDKNGLEIKGQIDAHTKDAAVASLHERGYIISSVKGDDDKGFFEKSITLRRVKNKEIVILTKQFSTLFGAQVSAIRIFQMISEESENEVIKSALVELADDISDGSSVTKAMKKHPDVFSPFYVNMVAAGEEAGQLSQTFEFLADYLERSYEMTSKVKSALIYPGFVLGVFVIVMYLMLTMVIPKISEMLVSGGNELPVSTEIVIGLSNFLVNYGFIFIVMLVGGGFLFVKYIKTPLGREGFDRFKISLPLFGKLYRDLFIARVAGNFNMMLKSGVAMIKTIESTSKVVDNVVYEKILMEVADDVRGGESLSKAFGKHDAFSSLFIQMVRVGEESGKLSDILGTIAAFYEKEIYNRLTVMVSLIEPIMITALGGGVGLLLSAVLLPIYSVTGNV